MKRIYFSVRVISEYNMMYFSKAQLIPAEQVEETIQQFKELFGRAVKGELQSLNFENITGNIVILGKEMLLKSVFEIIIINIEE